MNEYCNQTIIIDGSYLTETRTSLRLMMQYPEDAFSRTWYFELIYATKRPRVSEEHRTKEHTNLTILQAEAERLIRRQVNPQLHDKAMDALDRLLHPHILVREQETADAAEEVVE